MGLRRSEVRRSHQLHLCGRFRLQLVLKRFSILQRFTSAENSYGQGCKDGANRAGRFKFAFVPPECVVSVRFQETNASSMKSPIFKRLPMDIASKDIKGGALSCLRC